MKRLAAMIVLVPAYATADGGPAGHMHPHGQEGVLLALLGVGLAWVVWRLAK